MKSFGYYLLGLITGVAILMATDRKEKIEAGINAGIEAYKNKDM